MYTHLHVAENVVVEWRNSRHFVVNLQLIVGKKMSSENRKFKTFCHSDALLPPHSPLRSPTDFHSHARFSKHAYHTPEHDRGEIKVYVKGQGVEVIDLI